MRVFRARFSNDEEAVSGHPAWMRWWRPSGTIARVGRWFGGRVDGGTVQVALYAHDAEPGDPPALVFPAEGRALPGPEGLDEVIVFGDPEPNGCLVVEGPTGLVWPRFNPGLPGPHAPRR